MNTSTPLINRLPDGSLYNQTFAEEVRRYNLLDPDCMMGVREQVVVKAARPERNTVCVTLQREGPPFRVYVKRYRSPGLIRSLIGMLKGDLPGSGPEEFMNIVALLRAGIPVPTPIAAGVKQRGLSVQDSFLITHSLEGAVRLDHLLAEQPLPFGEKRALIKNLAQFARSLHDRGFNHRDLYLCHVLRDSAGNLWLVDLHRVQQRRSVPERWKVKDIAALHYSAPRPAVTQADLLFFLKTYCGGSLTMQDRRFARKVLKKTEKMIQHNRAQKTQAGYLQSHR